MRYSKHIRHFILAATAGLAIYLAPIADQEASAANADFSSSDLRETADKYLSLNIPYKSGGTTTAGFDCSGFVQHVFKDFDISLPRTSSSMYDVGESVKLSELRPGDLVFFNTTGHGISHVGVYYGDGKFVHSQNGQGVSLTSIFDKYYWADRYVGAKRVADVQLASQAN